MSTINNENLRTNQLNDIEFKTLDINPILKTRIIQEAFQLFDINENGVIEQNEIKVLLKGLNEGIDEKKIQEFIKAIDKDLNQEVSLEEFTDMMMGKEFTNVISMERHIQSIFDAYDKDEDGFISLDDIENAGKDLETDILAPDEMQLLIKFAKNMALQKNITSNVHSTNTISKEEFINLLLNVDFLYEVPEEVVYANNNKGNMAQGSTSNLISLGGDRSSNNISGAEDVGNMGEGDI
jgi:centrin-3